MNNPLFGVSSFKVTSGYANSYMLNSKGEVFKIINLNSSSPSVLKIPFSFPVKDIKIQKIGKWVIIQTFNDELYQFEQASVVGDKKQQIILLPFKKYRNHSLKVEEFETYASIFLFSKNKDMIHVCGNNSFGMSGLPHKINSELDIAREVNFFKNDPFQIKKVRMVVTGHYHTLFIADQGCRVVGVGYNTHGELGDGSCKDRQSPIIVEYFEKNQVRVIDGCAGYFHTILISRKKVYVFGYNTNGELGLGDFRLRDVPTVNPFFEKNDIPIHKVRCGAYFNVFFSSNNRVYLCGKNDKNQISESLVKKIAVPYLLNYKIADFSGGYSHGTFITHDGRVLITGVHNYQESNQNFRFIKGFKLFIEKGLHFFYKHLLIAKTEKKLSDCIIKCVLE